MIRVAIADDHTLFREGVRQLLQTEQDFEVVGEAANGLDAVSLVRESRPDLLLLDLAMPGQGGLEALRDIAALNPACRVVLLTADIDPVQTVEALRSGARGYVMKHSTCQLLCKSIRAVVAGEYWIGRDAVSDLVSCLSALSGSESSHPPSRRFGLTARELQVVRTAIAGGTNKEIAQRLGLSDDTVKHHLSSIFAKLGVRSRMEMALVAINHRLVDETLETRPPALPPALR